MSYRLQIRDMCFKLVSNGISDKKHTEEVRKTYLINIFNLVAILFVLPLGVNALLNLMYPLAFALLGISFILVGNYIYFKITSNQKVAAYVISILFFILITYLVYSGGVHNTGPLWIYPLPMILMFLLGFKKGLFFTILFLIINTIILFFPNELLLNTTYPYEFKVRIVLAFMLVTFLASSSEYLLEKSFNEMKKMKDSLENTLRLDPLTGLYNRRVYDEDYYNINSSKGVVLMCDIDHFKNINDTYGHTVGDLVLVEVAKCIRENIRNKDLAIRWGGEEFFIFLSDTTIDDGYSISEKLRKAVEDLLLRSAQNTILHITMSIGLAVVDDKISLDKAITNADNAMYTAKREGRNITMIHDR